MRIEVTHFARTDFRGTDRIFGIKDDDRFSHIYLVGKTGTGKSTLIETMVFKTSRAVSGSPSSTPTAIWSARVVPGSHRTGRRT